MVGDEKYSLTPKHQILYYGWKCPYGCVSDKILIEPYCVDINHHLTQSAFYANYNL